MSLRIEPADVVRIAEALDVDPYGLTAGRLLEEVAARAVERSSGTPGSGTERRRSADRDYSAEAEVEALGDAWLAYQGLPVDDGGRGYLGGETPDAPYPPDADEEALWRLHVASLGEEPGKGRSLAAGDEEEALWEAAAASLGLPEGERL